jgi:sugar O-acyltransferase (sialic acid O-acetyltransferase NeuD family)
MELGKSQAVLILGAGGHAKVLIDALQQSGRSMVGITDPYSALWGTSLMGVPILGHDDKILEYSPQEILLVNTLGSVKDTSARRRLFETWKAKGYTFAQVIHPRAICAPDVVLAEGVQVLAGAIINTASRIGQNTIVNTGAIVEHDCVIGAHIHIAPGARIAGQVTIGDHTHVGIGSTIIQNLTIGENCLIAAGAVVVKSVKAGSVLMGVPAKHHVKR